MKPTRYLSGLTATALIATAALTTITSAGAALQPGGAPPSPATQLACRGLSPSPACPSFPITNFGVYRGIAAGLEDATRAVFDWGAMWRTGSRSAVGASWLVAVGERETITGPAIRYRRWLGEDSSLDLGIGASVTSAHSKAGSVLGLIKYNPTHWVGLSVRPESQRLERHDCTIQGCPEATVTRTRIYGGVELGSTPGLVTSAVAGVVALLVSSITFSIY